MNLHTQLSRTIGIRTIREICLSVQGNDTGKAELWNLFQGDDPRVAHRAAWVLVHLPREEHAWLCEKRDIFIEKLLVCDHSGMRRMLLSLLLQLPLPDPMRVDFFDFCLEHMISRQEPPAVQSLCLKLAHKMCCPEPALMHELRLILEIMEPDQLSPALRSVRRNVLKTLY